MRPEFMNEVVSVRHSYLRTLFAHQQWLLLADIERRTAETLIAKEAELRESDKTPQRFSPFKDPTEFIVSLLSEHEQLQFAYTANAELITPDLERKEQVDTQHYLDNQAAYHELALDMARQNS
jgi:hypothetical protein